MGYNLMPKQPCYHDIVMQLEGNISCMKLATTPFRQRMIFKIRSPPGPLEWDGDKTASRILPEQGKSYQGLGRPAVDLRGEIAERVALCGVSEKRCGRKREIEVVGSTPHQGPSLSTTASTVHSRNSVLRFLSIVHYAR